MSRYVTGDKLPPALQEEAKRTNKDRFTGEHRPAWLDGPFVSSERRNAPADFEDDAAWLAHTEFPVSGEGAKLKLARNGQKSRTEYIRRPINGAGDTLTPQLMERLAIELAKSSGLPVWVAVEGQWLGNLTLHRPTIGLPSMWRVATPEGTLY